MIDRAQGILSVGSELGIALPDDNPRRARSAWHGPVGRCGPGAVRTPALLRLAVPDAEACRVSVPHDCSGSCRPAGRFATLRAVLEVV